MLPFRPADDAGVRPLSDEDHRLLLQLLHRNGLPSLLYALGSTPNSSAASAISASTLFSNLSLPSLAWTTSDASHGRSDDASIQTQSTWPEAKTEPQTLPEPEPRKNNERSWLDSPVSTHSPLPSSDVTSHPAMAALTSTKKYQCPMCFLDKSPVGFGRKSDFKKHLYNFHGSDVEWICRTKDCCLSFTTERAYSTHAKDVHKMRAIPNHSARTELCAQLVFTCGFVDCRERLFEAKTANESAATRDKYFEHIAKHFEDGLDVKQWQYRVQMENLMRQPQVKPIWKTCIWPKEQRQKLSWSARSSGDLRRMLQCRHLGNDTSTVVRLAYILGTAPFTSPMTPPPMEIDLYFQLPYRGLCLINSPDHAATSLSPTTEEDDNVTVTAGKRRHSRSSLTQSVLKLSGRQGKRNARTPKPTASSSGASSSSSTLAAPPAMARSGSEDVAMADDSMPDPHPGTPFPIPNEAVWPLDAPKFAPEIRHDLPRQMHASVDDSAALIDSMQLAAQTPQQQAWCAMEPFVSYAPAVNVDSGLYEYPVGMSEASSVRPTATSPYVRPVSWGQLDGTGSLPAKKGAAAHVFDPSCPPEVMASMMGV